VSTPPKELTRPQWAIWGARLAATGSELEAAKAVGRQAKWVRKQLELYPEILNACRRPEGHDEPLPTTWAELHERAVREVALVMTQATAPKDRLAAAVTVIDRVEGRVPQRIEVQEPEGHLLDTVFWRYVSNVFLQEGVSLDEAERRALADPAGVHRWGVEVGMIHEDGTDVQLAEVVEGRRLGPGGDGVGGGGGGGG